MRLLFLTNFYPPASRGGYEEWCHEVANNLCARGHEIVVLTSRYGRESINRPEPPWVCRDLHLEMPLVSLRNSLRFFTGRKVCEKENLAQMYQITKEFEPHGILIWGMWNLPRSLAALAEELMPGRVVYYMGDYWPTLPNQYEFYWQAPARSWLTAIPKRVLRTAAYWVLAREPQVKLDFGHVVFPSNFMRDELERGGISPHHVKIIYGAIDTRTYQCPNNGAHSQKDDRLRLLYVGRLTADKGVHTAIEALAKLVNQHDNGNIQLNIVGNGETDYTNYLKQLARQKGVADFVSFHGAQPKEKMPHIYNQSDIFLFTSIWQEPFGRVIVEAMASGVVVVGTATGGAAEIIKNNENGLVFSPDDADGLAAQLLRLIEAPSLRERLAEVGRQTALEKFDIHRMAQEIEAYLQSIVYQ